MEGEWEITQYSCIKIIENTNSQLEEDFIKLS